MSTIESGTLLYTVVEGEAFVTRADGTTETIVLVIANLFLADARPSTRTTLAASCVARVQRALDTTSGRCSRWSNERTWPVAM